jgi:hypothetical protein
VIIATGESKTCLITLDDIALPVSPSPTPSPTLDNQTQLLPPAPTAPTPALPDNQTSEQAERPPDNQTQADTITQPGLEPLVPPPTPPPTDNQIITQISEQIADANAPSAPVSQTINQIATQIAAGGGDAQQNK